MGTIGQINHVPHLERGQGSLGVRGRHIVVDVFPEGIAEFRQQRGVKEAWYGRRFRGESRREHGPSIHHLKGAQPQGLSGQSPYSEDNNWQKFSSVQRYLER